MDGARQTSSKYKKNLCPSAYWPLKRMKHGTRKPPHAWWLWWRSSYQFRGVSKKTPRYFPEHWGIHPWSRAAVSQRGLCNTKRKRSPDGSRPVKAHGRRRPTSALVWLFAAECGTKWIVVSLPRRCSVRSTFFTSMELFGGADLRSLKFLSSLDILLGKIAHHKTVWKHQSCVGISKTLGKTNSFYGSWGKGTNLSYLDARW